MRIIALPLIAASLVAAAGAGAETRQFRAGDTEVSIILSDAIEAHPDLMRFLRADADDIAAEFAAENAALATVEDAVLHDDGRFVSILRSQSFDHRGAHPNLILDPLNWDAKRRDFVRLDAFFDQGAPRDEALAAISNHLRKAIKAAPWSAELSETFHALAEQATVPDVIVLSNFTIEAGGLVFHYSPYAIAPYSTGPVTLRAPRAVFKAWLNADGRATFR